MAASKFDKAQNLTRSLLSLLHFASRHSHFEPIGPVNGGLTFTPGELAPYIMPGSEAEEHWWNSNPDGHTLSSKLGFTTGSTEAHRAANSGDVDKLKEILDQHQELVNKRDRNGWTPLHEAVRTGDLETIALLLERGADVNARMGQRGEAGSALYLAMEHHRDLEDEDSEVEAFLKQHGAIMVEPDL